MVDKWLSQRIFIFFFCYEEKNMTARKWSGPNRITLFVNLQISRTSQPLERGDSWGCKPYLLRDLWLQGGVWAFVGGPGGPSSHLSEGDRGASPACEGNSLLIPTFLLWPHTPLPTPRSPLTWTLSHPSQLSGTTSLDWQPSEGARSALV